MTKSLMIQKIQNRAQVQKAKQKQTQAKKVNITKVQDKMNNSLKATYLVFKQIMNHNIKYHYCNKAKIMTNILFQTLMKAIFHIKRNKMNLKRILSLNFDLEVQIHVIGLKAKY